MSTSRCSALLSTVYWRPIWRSSSRTRPSCRCWWRRKSFRGASSNIVCLSKPLPWLLAICRRRRNHGKCRWKRLKWSSRSSISKAMQNERRAAHLYRWWIVISQISRQHHRLDSWMEFAFRAIRCSIDLYLRRNHCSICAPRIWKSGRNWPQRCNGAETTN